MGASQARRHPTWDTHRSTMLTIVRDFLREKRIFGTVLTKDRRPIKLAAITLASLVVLALIQVIAAT